MVISKTTVLRDIYDATEKSSVTSITILLSVSAWLSTALHVLCNGRQPTS